MAFTFGDFKEQLARTLATEPINEPRVDTVPMPSDEESEALGREIDDHPIPFRHRKGRS